MNWKKEAENELRDYPKIKSSIGNLTGRIDALEARQTSIRSSGADSVSVPGGGNRYEDNLINCIVEKERLVTLRAVNEKRVKIIERGLASLTDTERKIISRFYFDGLRYPAAVERLRGEIGYEEAQINRLRNTALYHYTLAEFGLPEL